MRTISSKRKPSLMYLGPGMFSGFMNPSLRRIFSLQSAKPCGRATYHGLAISLG